MVYGSEYEKGFETVYVTDSECEMEYVRVSDLAYDLGCATVKEYDSVYGLE